VRFWCDSAIASGIFPQMAAFVVTRFFFRQVYPYFSLVELLQLWMQDAEVDLGAITLFGLVSSYSSNFFMVAFIRSVAPPVLGARRG